MRSMSKINRVTTISVIFDSVIWHLEEQNKYVIISYLKDYNLCKGQGQYAFVSMVGESVLHRIKSTSQIGNNDFVIQVKTLLTKYLGQSTTL